MGSAGLTVATDELIVATLDKQERKVWDQYYEKIPIFGWLKSKDKVGYDGGYTIRIPIRIGKNTSSGTATAYQTLETAPVSTIREVLYYHKTYYATVTYSEQMKLINRGNYAAVKLIMDKLDDAKNSIRDNINIDLLASSTATNGVTSLFAAVDSTGAVGGLNQSTQSAWASHEDSSVGSFAAGGTAAMQLAFNTVSKGMKSGSPDLIVTDYTTFGYYQDAVRAFGGDYFASKGDLGVPTLKFMGAEVIPDNDCQSGFMLFLNSNAIELSLDGQANMKSTPFTKPPDQMAYIGQIYCNLELVVRERRALAKLGGITA